MLINLYPRSNQNAKTGTIPCKHYCTLFIFTGILQVVWLIVIQLNNWLCNFIQPYSHTVLQYNIIQHTTHKHCSLWRHQLNGCACAAIKWLASTKHGRSVETPIVLIIMVLKAQVCLACILYILPWPSLQTHTHLCPSMNAWSILKKYIYVHNYI